MTEFEDKREVMLKSLKENDTYDVEDFGVTFGRHSEYYCLYLQKFFYKPWGLARSIEFRPFRNVRMLESFSNYRKIGYFKEWLLNPEYTYQYYTNGEPCAGDEWLNKNSTTIVKYLCGLDNRIVGFRELKECTKYELTFESPFNCEVRMTDKDSNLYAMDNLSVIYYFDLPIFLISFFAFIFGSCLCLILKKKKF